MLTFAPLTGAVHRNPVRALLLAVLRDLAFRLLACVPASALPHRLPADVATDGHRPVPGRIIILLLMLFLMLPFHVPWHLDHELDHADRREWYLAFNRTWPPSRWMTSTSPAASCGLPELALLMLIALFAQWYAHSQREARREDRRLDPTGIAIAGADRACRARRDHEEPARYDQARTGQAAEAEMRPAGTGGQPGDDQ